MPIGSNGVSSGVGRRRCSGASAADRAQRNRATRPCARRRSRRAARRAWSAREDWRRAIRSARPATAAVAAAAGAGACAFASALSLALPPASHEPCFALALALRLALAGGVEAGGAGARSPAGKVDGDESSARASALCPTAGSAADSADRRRAPDATAKSGRVSASAPAIAAGQQRGERPGAERETEKRKAKARHSVTPGPDRARFPSGPCPARAEKCVSNQLVAQISTAPGGPSGWAVRGSPSALVNEAKTVMVNGTLTGPSS